MVSVFSQCLGVLVDVMFFLEMLDLKATMLCLTCGFGCLNGTDGLACFDGLNHYGCCNRLGGLDWFCGLWCISGLQVL